ncbi:MAG: hypothetical protein JO345_14855 [Streptosporangiaceae bacterium]|nr:hypothetical protein [Streptosporangiaceae bacterium]
MKTGVSAVAALTLTALAAATGMAASSAWPASPAGVRAEVRSVRDDASWIREAQLPDGAIEPVPDYGRILPYVASYAALGLARAAGELRDHADADAAWRWLTWYQAHQDAAGFVTDYLVAGGAAAGGPGQFSTETSAQAYDSTDAYAGMFLAAAGAAWQADPDQNRLKSLARGITKAVAAIEATQTADGLTWATPGYHKKLLMDNAEVYGGLRSAAMLATALGEPALATRATMDARRVASGVASLWNPRSGGFNWARAANGTNSAPSWTVLYPDAMENVWAIAYGLATPAQAASILSHLERMQPRWTEPDQSAPIDTDGDVSRQPVGYWPVGGWALTLTGRPDQALNAAATISAGAAAQQRIWPFTTADAGELIALRSGWPATAPWAAPPSAAGHFPALGLAAILLAALAAAGSLTVLTRRRHRAS